jgi:ABC-type proline/glycine betaine transport system substrate-binding protein
MKTVRDQVMPAYGLGDYQLVEGRSPAMYASLDAAVKQKQPIVVPLWQPHWAFSRGQGNEQASVTKWVAENQQVTDAWFNGPSN